MANFGFDDPDPHSPYVLPDTLTKQRAAANAAGASPFLSIIGMSDQSEQGRRGTSADPPFANDPDRYFATLFLDMLQRQRTAEKKAVSAARSGFAATPPMYQETNGDPNQGVDYGPVTRSQLPELSPPSHSMAKLSPNGFVRAVEFDRDMGEGLAKVYDAGARAVQSGYERATIKDDGTDLTVPNAASDFGKGTGSGVINEVIRTPGSFVDGVLLVADIINDLEAGHRGMTPEAYKAELAKQAVLPDFTPYISARKMDEYGRWLAERYPEWFGFIKWAQDYRPESFWGHLGQTAGGFLPSALSGPGGIARKLAANVAAPAVASEIAGELTKGTKYEPLARGAAALTANTSALMATRKPSHPLSGTASRHPGWLSSAGDQAEQLFQEAYAAGRPLTRPEALHHVTNGRTTLMEAQAALEHRRAFGDRFELRSAETEATARHLLDEITPRRAQHSKIGPRIGDAARKVIRSEYAAIDQTSTPFYEALVEVSSKPQTIRRALGSKRDAIERFIKPELEGPLGKLLRKDLTTQQAYESLFHHRSGAAQKIEESVAAMATHKPYAVHDLVRHGVDKIFADAKIRLAKGIDANPGQNFVQALRRITQRKGYGLGDRQIF